MSNSGASPCPRCIIVTSLCAMPTSSSFPRRMGRRGHTARCRRGRLPTGVPSGGSSDKTYVIAKEQQPFPFPHGDPTRGDHGAFLLTAAIYLEPVPPNCIPNFTTAAGEPRWVNQPSRRYRPTNARGFGPASGADGGVVLLMPPPASATVARSQGSLCSPRTASLPAGSHRGAAPSPGAWVWFSGRQTSAQETLL